MGAQCCCWLGTEVHWVSSEDLGTVLSDCIALTRHLGLMLTSARNINFHHTQKPWNSLQLHHRYVGSLVTKKS